MKCLNNFSKRDDDAVFCCVKKKKQISISEDCWFPKIRLKMRQVNLKNTRNSPIKVSARSFIAHSAFLIVRSEMCVVTCRAALSRAACLLCWWATYGHTAPLSDCNVGSKSFVFIKKQEAIVAAPWKVRSEDRCPLWIVDSLAMKRTERTREMIEIFWNRKLSR